MENIKYTDYTIGFQEVPNETSLVINLSNCPHYCEGCHSPHLRKNIGHNLTPNILEKILDKYNGMITCICFLGGDNNVSQLHELCYVSQSRNIKTCIYSGNDTFNEHKELFDVLDFIKIGHYDISKGGLNQFGTNQKFYSIKGNSILEITHLFQS